MDEKRKKQNPEWLDEFEDLANEQLTEGSACAQVHPIIAAWYEEIMDGDPPESRDAVWQALHCLTTEVLIDMPESVTKALDEHDVEEDLANWVTELLLVGRAFQIALDNGRLDDL
ncbi:MAG: hypothetical protein GYB65_03295 [Chloroflexi bacterium]|nr:hypothetical protein [Chloroflexota bacterium]